MSGSHLMAVRRAAFALTLVAAFHAVPIAAQNPPAPASPPQPMACDSMCQMHRHMMGEGGAMGGGMMCPMMGGMQGMGGMHGMMGMGHMGGMPGMGPMSGPPDSASVRQAAEGRAAATRAYYEALVRKGFTAEQALRIVTAQ
jgi:hypothetical protein